MERNRKLAQSYSQPDLDLGRNQLDPYQFMKRRYKKELTFEVVVTKNGIIDEVEVENTWYT